MDAPLYDLSDVPFDAIWGELYKRYSAIALVVERDAPNRDGKPCTETQTWTYYKGSLSCAMGLLRYADNRLRREQMANVDAIADDEEEEH